jgi:hypothetical protein
MSSRYRNIKPSEFQVGDMVEASLAFVAVPIRGGRYIAMPQLRALTLLDNSKCQVRKTTQSACFNSCRFQQPTDQAAKKDSPGCKHSASLKRRKLYTTEDNIDETRGKMAKMSIDK